LSLGINKPWTGLLWSLAKGTVILLSDETAICYLLCTVIYGSLGLKNQGGLNPDCFLLDRCTCSNFSCVLDTNRDVDKLYSLDWFNSNIHI